MSTSYGCPRCLTALASHKLKDKVAFKCASCAGLAVNLAVLRAQIHGDVISSLWRHASSAQVLGSCPCPACKAPMRALTRTVEATQVEVDLCTSCQLMWLDHRELEALWTLGLTKGSAAKPRPNALRAQAGTASSDSSAFDVTDVVEIALEAVFCLFD